MTLGMRVLVVGGLLSACRISVPEGRLPCESARDCPITWACHEGSCTRGLRPSQARGDSGQSAQGPLDGASAEAAVPQVGSSVLPDAGEPSGEPLGARDASQRTAADAQRVDAAVWPCVQGDCACSEGEARPCYTAAIETLGRGRCVAGVEVCRRGSFGPCQDERLPRAETCANLGSDDDCDGVVDEGTLDGAVCLVQGQLGRCAAGRLSCRAAQDEPLCSPRDPVAESCNDLDDDCDGQTDEGFALDSDVRHCGACGSVCQAGQACCGGVCVSELPEDYAAACGGECGDPGTIQCDGSCSRPDPDDYAEPCGHCGGSIQCDGSCSQPDPPDYGERCRDGVSSIGCTGECECLRTCPSGVLVPCAMLCPIVICSDGVC